MALAHCSEAEAFWGRPEPPSPCQVEGRNWKRPPAPMELTARGLPPDSHGMTADRNRWAEAGWLAAWAGAVTARPVPTAAARAGPRTSARARLEMPRRAKSLLVLSHAYEGRTRRHQRAGGCRRKRGRRSGGKSWKG